MGVVYLYTVVIIDYKSFDRTIRYINDFLANIKSKDKVNFVIVDNSINSDNFESLKKGLDINNKVLDVTNEIVNNNVLPEGEAKQVLKLQYDFSGMSIEIVLIENSKNSGFAKGNNMGASVTQFLFKSPYIIFSNNDIIFEEKLDLDLFENCFNNDKSIALIGPKVVGLDGTAQSPHKKLSFFTRWTREYMSWPITYSIRRLGLRKFLSSEDLIHLNSSSYVYRIIGAFMVFKSDKFFEIGMFDENTFLYCEELIIAERLIRKKLKTYFLNEVKIIHENGGTTKKSISNIKKLKIRFNSEAYYFENYVGVRKINIRLTKFFLYTYIYTRTLINKLSH